MQDVYPVGSSMVYLWPGTGYPQCSGASCSLIVQCPVRFAVGKIGAWSCRHSPRGPGVLGPTPYRHESATRGADSAAQLFCGIDLR